MARGPRRLTVTGSAKLVRLAGGKEVPALLTQTLHDLNLRAPPPAGICLLEWRNRESSLAISFRIGHLGELIADSRRARTKL